VPAIAIACIDLTMVVCYTQSMLRNARLASAITFQAGREVLWNLTLILFGSFICAIGINGILIPSGFISGGVTGLVLIVHKLFPALNFGGVYFLCNVPLFLFAYKSVGRRFFWYSLFGVLVFSGIVGSFTWPIHLEEPILRALLGGILFGAGTGVILRSYGSAGGLDILSVYLLKRLSISLGNTILAVNCLVLLLVGFFFSLEAVLYTVILQYVSSRIVNLVVTGLSQRKAVFIISPEWEAISKEILSDIRRGVTVLEGKGGYTGRPEHIIYTVITLREVGQLKRLVQQIDPQAFVVVSSTIEVVNYRIGNQPHW